VRFDYPHHRGQADAGSPTGRFGGEEGLEDVRQDVGRDSAAGVGDPNLDVRGSVV